MADVIIAGSPTSVYEYPVAFLKRKKPVEVVTLEKGVDFEPVDSSADPDQKPAEAEDCLVGSLPEEDFILPTPLE